jgi:hypothetical protein
LTYEGNILLNDKTLIDYDIKNDFKLNLDLKLSDPFNLTIISFNGIKISF